MTFNSFFNPRNVPKSETFGVDINSLKKIDKSKI
jgi:hypothetical protein